MIKLTVFLLHQPPPTSSKIPPPLPHLSLIPIPSAHHVQHVGSCWLDFRAELVVSIYVQLDKGLVGNLGIVYWLKPGPPIHMPNQPHHDPQPALHHGTSTLT